MNGIFSLLKPTSQKHLIQSIGDSARKKQMQYVSLILFNRFCLITIFSFLMMCIQSVSVLAATDTVTAIISTDGTWKYPKVRTDSNGIFYVMYWDDVSSTINFDVWNGEAWENHSQLTSASVPGVNNISYGNDYQANFDFDSNNNLHVLFAGGISSQAITNNLYHGEYNGSIWTFSLIHNTDNLPEEVSIFIDSQNHLHTAYRIDAYPFGRNHVLTYATNKTGSWQVQEILETLSRDLDELHDNYVMVDSTGKVIIIYRREDLQNLHEDNYYITDSSNNFTTQTAIPHLQGTSDLKEYIVGNAILDANDFIHLVYSNETDSTAHYLTNLSGVWTDTDISALNPSVTGVFDISPANTGLRILGETSSGYQFQRKIVTGSWLAGISFSMNGDFSDRFMMDQTSKTTMLVYENSTTWEIGSLALVPRKFSWPMFLPAMTRNN